MLDHHQGQRLCGGVYHRASAWLASEQLGRGHREAASEKEGGESVSIAHINAAFRAPGMTTAEKMVLLVLADHARTDGICWPSMATIAERASMTERGVRAIVRRLESTGAIRLEEGGGRGKSNRYRVLIEALNPAPASEFNEETRNEKPGMTFPLNDPNPEPPSPFMAETRNLTALNPEPCAGEPLRTTIRKDRHEGGSARVGEAPVEEECFGIRERILVAAKHDRSGMTATGRMIGSPTDMMSVTRWHGLGLSDDEIIEVISHIAAGAHYEPIGAFRYFDQPMQRHAGLKSAPALKAVEGRQRAPSEMEARVRDGSDTLERMRKKYALE